MPPMFEIEITHVSRKLEEVACAISREDCAWDGNNSDPSNVLRFRCYTIYIKKLKRNVHAGTDSVRRRRQTALLTNVVLATLWSVMAMALALAMGACRHRYCCFRDLRHTRGVCRPCLLQNKATKGKTPACNRTHYRLFRRSQGEGSGVLAWVQLVHPGWYRMA